jgi:hypothetical protein
VLNDPSPNSDVGANGELEELRSFIVDLHDYVGMIHARSEALLRLLVEKGVFQQDEYDHARAAATNQWHEFLETQLRDRANSRALQRLLQKPSGKPN